MWSEAKPSKSGQAPKKIDSYHGNNHILFNFVAPLHN